MVLALNQLVVRASVFPDNRYRFLVRNHTFAICAMWQLEFWQIYTSQNSKVSLAQISLVKICFIWSLILAAKPHTQIISAAEPPITYTWEIENFNSVTSSAFKYIHHPQNSSINFYTTIYPTGPSNFLSNCTQISICLMSSDQPDDEAHVRMSILGSGKTLVYGKL